MHLGKILVLSLASAVLSFGQAFTVTAFMDIYRAGGYDDGSDGISPAVFTFPASAGDILTFPSVTGSWTCQGGVPEYGPSGTVASPCFHAGGQSFLNPIGPFAGYASTDFVEALVGMFLEDGLPPAPPPPLRFFIQNGSPGGFSTESRVLTPQVGQVFFIGNGHTQMGELQIFRVPAKATHLYLGFTDNCGSWINTTPGCYFDNAGSVTATIHLQRVR